MRDPRHDILFTPLQIGPKTAKNRFYQVPHCNGGGYRDPSAVVEMRRTKAEGGWGVIFTEQTEIHPTSEITPFIEQHLWDDRDIPALARMADAMKSHGALAGIQLAYSGINGPNLYSREVPLAVTGGPILTFTSDPVQARTMDKEDIRDLRRWFRNAFRRSQQAGFDLICLYGAHGFGILQHFLSRATNHRTDEYGGNLTNRARFLREIVEDARETTKGELAITLRMSLHEAGPQGFSNAELRDFIAMHADLPDLWDLAQGTWEACSGTARFKDEGAQEDLVRGIKDLTPKPVVGVGRFTSADAMVRQIKAGILDFIGAARPSIADPFLPRKVQEGRYEDIRECIGCNICVSGDMTQGISRCTQNTAFMEEWRKGWHPERPRPRGTSESVLIVGAGPTGLEAALQAAKRGYKVTLAEATTTLGGRVTKERALPGLFAWGRVADYRTGQLAPLPNVEIYRDSPLTPEDILAMQADHVAIATGAIWRRDAVARLHLHPIPTDPAMPVYTPDDLMAGHCPMGQTVALYDDDHFYMGSVLAELLIAKGNRVHFITPAVKVAEWTDNTLEQGTIMRRLLDLGVETHLSKAPEAIGAKEVTLACTWTGRQTALPCDAVLHVTSRTPNDRLYHQTKALDWQSAGIKTLKLIGDAAAPGPIAWATYAGRNWAESLDQPDPGDALTFRREIAALDPGPSLLPRSAPGIFCPQVSPPEAPEVLRVLHTQGRDKRLAPQGAQFDNRPSQGPEMTHFRHRTFNTRDTYPEQKLDNDLAQAVVARGRIVFLRGQCPQDLDTAKDIGSHDPVEQTHKVMQNIRQLLEEVGGKMEHLCKVVVYLTDVRHREAVYRTMGEYIKGVHPVSTGVVVTALARPSWLVEIDGTAVIPDEA